MSLQKQTVKKMKKKKKGEKQFGAARNRTRGRVLRKRCVSVRATGP